MSENSKLRFDLRIIASWIEPGSRVLDLGCGEGDLLYHLKKHKNVDGSGIDRHEDKVALCISKGLTVVQGDINIEIEDYQENSFDYVVLSQTLQQVYEPEKIIKSLLKVGQRAIVSFPNFSHWGIRLQLLFKGIAPKNRQLPFDWYNTPNIRVVTIKDFRRFADKMGISIFRETAINTQNQDLEGKIIHFLPNLRANYGILLIGKKSGS